VESRYPRLVALKIILSICEPIRHSSLPSNVQLLPGTTIPSITQSLNDFEDKIRSSHFKYSEYKLADTRIRGFNAVVDDLLQGKLRGSASKGRFNSLKDDEIVVIQDVEHCRSSFDSLFQLLVRNMPCSNLHSAWVHLSGFRRRELDVVIVACHDNQKHTATCRRQMRHPPSRISESLTLASAPIRRRQLIQGTKLKFSATNALPRSTASWHLTTMPCGMMHSPYHPLLK
jgi:hypothetical protein